MKLFLTNFALVTYGLVKKTGILEWSFSKALFIRLYFFYKKHIEDPFYALLSQRPDLLKGGNVLDVGANIGYTATLFSKFIDPKFKVFAFEPDLSNYKMLTQVASRNSNNIIPIQSAVGNSDGAITLWQNEKHHADHRVLTTPFRDKLNSDFRTSEVPIVKLDSFVLQNGISSSCRFIKIDVQGFELAVCQGMDNLLLNSPSVIVAIEYMPLAMAELGFDSLVLLSFFESKDYLPYIILPKGQIKLTDFESIKKDPLPPRGYLDILFSKAAID